MERYSTFGARFFAGLLDGLVFIPIFIIDRFIGSPDHGVAQFLAWSAFLYSSFWLYTVLFHWRTGQTLGKRAVGVKVLDVSETRLPTLQQALLRDIGYIVLNTFALAYLFYLVLNDRYSDLEFLNSTPSRIANWAGWCWFLLEIVTMLTNQKRRALHDFIARTVVVRGA
jgi:uncharacterized RDD family membrane protein YckC